jgi:hypothetical protein
MNGGAVATRRAAWMVLGLFAACTAPAGAVVDLDGHCVDPRVVPPACVHVVVFTSHECPIANAYAPTLQHLAALHAPSAVHWFLVHVDPDLSAAAAREHANAFGLPGTILLDPQHELVRALQATKTPEAVVLGAAGLCYRGRIDDQWRALGARGQATQNDLEQAIARARLGQKSDEPWPVPVGCLLPEPRRTSATPFANR